MTVPLNSTGLLQEALFKITTVALKALLSRIPTNEARLSKLPTHDSTTHQPTTRLLLVFVAVAVTAVCPRGKGV